MIEGIKVFGERNSGNNYIMHLLDKNLDLKYTTRERFINKHMGWTHGKTQTYDQAEVENILFVLIFKNPYSWLLSFKDKPHTHELNTKFKKLNFFGFLQTPCEGYENPIEMLMEKYYDYLNFTKYNAVRIQYEDTLKDPKSIIADIVNTFSVLTTPSYFTPITQQTHPSSRLLDKPFDKKDYYLNEEWKSKLGTRDIEFINKHLDADVMDKLGYEWI